MLETAFAQLRFAASLFFGTRFSLHSLDQLLNALRDTRREFGAIGAEGPALLGTPALDDETRHTMQLRRFRTQAVRAARETRYYQRLFERLDLDPARLRYEDIVRLPLTPKDDLRADPDAFVRHTATPYLRAMTTGTTGKPTCVCFSEYELRVYFALSALPHFFSQDLTGEDIVQISTSARGTLGNVCLAGACAHLGAMVYLAGVTEPALALALLTEKRQVAGKKARTSVLFTYPSYLGEILECGLRLGYRPADFGLERILVGGEVVTAGLKTRSRQLFGPVLFDEGYGMTEIWPFGGRLCEAGHLHFEVSQGLLEVHNFQTAAPAQAGEIGTLVATPFPPYRETTLVLRYDTGDVVRRLPAEALSCSLHHMPATSNLLGKLALSVRHEQGWTFPRQVAEALEAVEAVPLPARYSFWAVPGGVAVAVVAPTDSPGVRQRIETSLQEQGVSVRELRLVGDRAHLPSPMPLRGDLREAAFSGLMREGTRTDEARARPEQTDEVGMPGGG